MPAGLLLKRLQVILATRSAVDSVVTPHGDLQGRRGGPSKAALTVEFAAAVTCDRLMQQTPTPPRAQILYSQNSPALVTLQPRSGSDRSSRLDVARSRVCGQDDPSEPPGTRAAVPHGPIAPALMVLSWGLLR